MMSSQLSKANSAKANSAKANSATSTPTAEHSGKPGDRQGVALIHGLGSNRVLMMPLAYQMKRAGYQAKLFGYFTFFGSIPQHAKRFADYLMRLEEDHSIDQWHIVAHSLGSIITRQMLCDHEFSKLGRVVMLSPPNQGSRAAKVLSYLVPLSTTVRQITDRDDSFVRQMPSPSDVEIGVVAASHDRVVTSQSSHLPSESDHVTIYSGHNGLLVRRRAATEVLAFLQTGRFTRESTCAGN